MPIRSIEYEELESGWKLERAAFGELNLLVGASAVGKSRILNSLLSVQSSALTAHAPAHCEWRLECSRAETLCSWEARTGAPPPLQVSLGQAIPGVPILRESAQAGGRTVLEREVGRLALNGRELPQLNPAYLALSTYNREPGLECIFENLARIRRCQDYRAHFAAARWPAGAFAQSLNGEMDLEALRAAGDLPLAIKLLIAQRRHAECFARIAERFREAFPSVNAFWIETEAVAHGAAGAMEKLALHLEESGARGPIESAAFSEGMIRALGLIADFELQAPGTIFLIDELETSLGVNCLPAIADLINDKKSEFQIVVTSHHPYIINNIPAENWKVVTRAGSTVRVMDYDSLPALHTQSRHERFIQLINLPEYEDGIR